MTEILGLANKSRVKNKVIILDCCYSGNMGTPNIADNGVAQLAEGVTVLTASRGSEVAMEQGNGGVFTDLVVAALQGGAADLRGHITPGSIYAYVDQALGAHGTNVRYLRQTSHNSLHCVRFSLKYHWKRCGSSSTISPGHKTSTRLIRVTRTRRRGATRIT